MLLDLLDLCAHLFDITGSPVARREFLNSRGSRAQSFLNLLQAVSDPLICTKLTESQLVNSYWICRIFLTAFALSSLLLFVACLKNRVSIRNVSSWRMSRNVAIAQKLGGHLETYGKGSFRVKMSPSKSLGFLQSQAWTKFSRSFLLKSPSGANYFTRTFFPSMASFILTNFALKFAWCLPGWKREISRNTWKRTRRRHVCLW